MALHQGALSKPLLYLTFYCATPSFLRTSLYNNLPRSLYHSNSVLPRIASTVAFVPSILSIWTQIWESILRAVPKKRTSHRKKRQRFLAGKALKDVTNLNTCSACGNVKRAHLLCPYCVAGNDHLNPAVSWLLMCCRYPKYVEKREFQCYRSCTLRIFQEHTTTEWGSCIALGGRQHGHGVLCWGGSLSVNLPYIRTWWSTPMGREDQSFELSILELGHPDFEEQTRIADSPAYLQILKYEAGKSRFALFRAWGARELLHPKC